MNRSPDLPILEHVGCAGEAGVGLQGEQVVELKNSGGHGDHRHFHGFGGLDVSRSVAHHVNRRAWPETLPGNLYSLTEDVYTVLEWMRERTKAEHISYAVFCLKKKNRNIGLLGRFFAVLLDMMFHLPLRLGPNLLISFRMNQ